MTTAKGFRADNAGGTTFTVNAETTLLHANVLFDTESRYNTLTGEYTVPAAFNGQYMNFWMQGRWTTFDSLNNCQVRIKQNGTTVAFADYGRTNRPICVTGPIQVVSGDVFITTMAISVARTYNNNYENYFAGALLSA